jgi:hypothetical protein
MRSARRTQPALVSSEPLLVDYVSVHTPEEDDIVQERAARATYDILRRAFSNEVITPGTTTLMDVHYWITAERKRQNFEFNFNASLDLQRFAKARSCRWMIRTTRSSNGATCCTWTSACGWPASSPTSRRWPTSSARESPQRRRA